MRRQPRSWPSSTTRLPTAAIQVQDAIAALYSNAQNPFVDCNTSWALPYINYCRITGLADGMTATTYAPNRELTGVQWLKLMLTTLNFDTAKEGYTGTGWDVNVLNRANESRPDRRSEATDWKAIAPIKRGEAAQVLYNALTKLIWLSTASRSRTTTLTTRPSATTTTTRFHLQRAGCQVRLYAWRKDGYRYRACD